jgi:glutamyl-tRNA synthetase
LILRVEDTDTAREQEGSEAAILEDLRWLGLTWDEGPEVGGPHGPYRQSERGALYAEAAAVLLGEGRAYRCFCSDEELAREREAQRAAGMPPRYPGYVPRAGGDRVRPPGGGGRALRGAIRVLPAKPSLADLRVVFEDRLRGRIEVGPRSCPIPCCCGGTVGRPTTSPWWWTTPPWTWTS